jgi:predicted amino acid racemase
MLTPRLEIELHKIAHNTRKLIALYDSKGIRITAITKGICGSPEIARAMLSCGITSLGDSRITNIQKMREAGLEAQFMLIRSPIPSETEHVVRLADISLNSEISVIRLIAKHAVKQGKIHQIILMIELGDLREGILPHDVNSTVEEIIDLEGVDLVGIGTNLACFFGIKPTEAKMRGLSSLANDIQREFGIELRIISGGNSANYQWFVSTKDIGGINHLRVGESILLGCDTLTRKQIPGLYTDAFTLVGEVIELKTKPSIPSGEITQDAFGRIPVFKDKGEIKKAILAIGKQDIDETAIKPRIDADILGASSDHLILDSKDSYLEVGMEVRFDVNYCALLRAMTSPFVEKVYLPWSHPICDWNKRFVESHEKDLAAAKNFKNKELH